MQISRVMRRARTVDVVGNFMSTTMAEAHAVFTSALCRATDGHRIATQVFHKLRLLCGAIDAVENWTDSEVMPRGSEPTHCAA